MSIIQWLLMSLKSLVEIFWASAVFNAAGTYEFDMTYLEDDKVFIAFKDSWDSSYWKCVVGTISWNSITYWAEYTFSAFTSTEIGCTKIDTNKVAILHGTWTTKVIVASISWTVVTFWTAVEVNAEASDYWYSIIKVDTNKFALTYTHYYNSNAIRWYVIVWTVSWTTITAWTKYQFSWKCWGWTQIIEVATNKIMVAYVDNNNSGRFSCQVAEITWLVVGTYWSIVIPEWAQYAGWWSLIKATDNNVIITFNISAELWALTASVSWTTITPWNWTKLVASSASSSVTSDFYSVAKITTNKYMISVRFYNGTIYTWIAVIFTVSWSTVVVWTTEELTTSRLERCRNMQVADNKVMTIYHDYDNSHYGTWKMYTE